MCPLLAIVSVARASSKMTATMSVLQARAVLIREDILKMCSVDAMAKTLRSFAASSGWAIRFVQRHSLRTVNLHEEERQVDATSVATGISNLKFFLNTTTPTASTT